MPSYLSLSTFKLFLRVTTTTDDVPMGVVLDGVEAACETWIGRGPLAYSSQTEYYSPSGESRITLDRFPLQSAAGVTGVWEDWNGNWGQTSGSFDATTSLLTAGDQYAVELEGTSKRAVLVRLGTTWPYSRRFPVGFLSSLRSEGFGTVKVTYSAGWSASAPADVISACYAEAAARWKMMSAGGWGFPSSESVAGASASITPFPFEFIKGTPFVTPLLAGATKMYRRIPVARG